MQYMLAIPTGRKVSIALCAGLAGFAALCAVFYGFTDLFVLAVEHGLSLELLWRFLSVLPYCAALVGSIVGLIVGRGVYRALLRNSLVWA
jgi:hypothetical protein